MPTYSEFIAKTQNDILSAVAQAQESNLKTLSTIGDTVAEYSAKMKQYANGDALPSPAQVIESGFGFAAQLVELQKQYYVRAAETFAMARNKAMDGFVAPKAKNDK